MKIHGSILKMYRDLHSWVGIGAGILLFICFVAGSLTMFDREISAWAQPVKQHYPIPELSAYDDAYAQLQQLHPKAAAGVTVYFNADAPAPFVWQETPSRGFQLRNPLYYAGLDQNGQLQVSRSETSQLGELIDLLHRTAGIPGLAGHHYLGEIVMGVASLLYFIALVSGVVLLLPNLVQDFFSLRRQSHKKFWLDSHNLLGLTSLPFHIVISITVVVFAFHDPIYDHLEQYVQVPEAEQFVPQQPAQSPDTSLQPISRLYQQARAQGNGATVTELRMMLSGPRQTVRAALQSEPHYTRGARNGYLMLNPATAEVQNNAMVPGAQPGYGAAVDLAFAAHFGGYGGYGLKWLYFLLGLAGAVLFYSGNLLWLETRRVKQLAAAQPAKVRFVAALTVGACNGCLLGLAASLLASKWLSSTTGDINSLTMALYYLVFICTLVWSFAQGAAKSALLQLKLLALLLLAVPLSSLLAPLVPATGIWPARDGSEWLLEFTVLVLALGCYAFAALLQRRFYQAKTDSIWALA
ncbi:PepSY-associated TM helix domain-containing protein [Rheinheimera aquimaris]|uniref:PepSY-associated TM helix domain-containing protein n=1 Tax=Rheinheimera aquimaris TaxID=412437 RepID=UPI001E2B9CA2|nr:PepSY-associated TM helix domain-containing protein [Rheinheimera aquimaris]MCD1598196.1 PepSY domain-containing protein [Rheinheimera aquimaris]